MNVLGRTSYARGNKNTNSRYMLEWTGRMKYDVSGMSGRSFSNRTCSITPSTTNNLRPTSKKMKKASRLFSSPSTSGIKRCLRPYSGCAARRFGPTDRSPTSPILSSSSTPSTNKAKSVSVQLPLKPTSQHGRTCTYGGLCIVSGGMIQCPIPLSSDNPPWIRQCVSDPGIG